MHVQLIHPPAYVNPTALTGLRPSLPIGLAYIAGAAQAAGHRVSVIDAVGLAPDRVTPERNVGRLGCSIEEIVERLDPDVSVIGVTAMFTYQWPLVKDLLFALKQARPAALLVGGGEHFTGLPELSLETAPLDIAVIGEGEDTLIELLARWEAHVAAGGDARTDVSAWAEGLRGTAYRKNGKVVQDTRRDRIRAVDDIARPAWELFDVAGYDERRLVNGVRAGRTMPILATRGCPYQCSYCSSPNAWTTRWVPRDPKLVVDEIEHYARTYGATNFPFHDLTAILKRSWIVEFCNELLARKLDVSWQFPTGTRCEVVDDEVADLLRRTGALQVNFAPESGSERVREKIQKRMKEESLFDAVKAATRNKLNVTCFFVLGFPGDEVEDCRATVAWAARLAKLGVDDIACGFYFPIPGTKFFRELEAQGKAQLTDELIMAPIYVQDSRIVESRNFSGTLTARQLTYWKYRVVWAFYSRAVLANPSRLLRILRNLATGNEDSKLDSFLRILRDRFSRRRAPTPG